MQIDWTKVSAELKAQFEARLPAGLTLDNLKFADSRVIRVEALPAFSMAEAKIAEDLEKAGGPPMITDGRPTAMRVVAWGAHETINKNRLAFVRDDLIQAAAKIAEPNFLPMDFNHSAVDGWGFGQKAIGVWYRAEVIRNPKADNAWGMLLTGMMWSWMNPDLANRLLAEQARNGHMDFSMACVCGTVTKAKNEDGPYEIAGDTTFFTVSALDVPPADPAAIGTGVEGSTDPLLEESLRLEFTAQPALEPAAAALATAQLAALAAVPTGGQMDELLAQLKDLAATAAKLTDSTLKESLMATVDAKLAELTAKIDGEVALRAELVTVQATLATAQAALVAAEASILEYSTKAIEGSVVQDALKAEIATANAEVERLGTELTAATTKLAVFEAADAAAAETAKLAARIEALPKAYRDAFAKRTEEEQANSKARWTKMSDVEWAAHLDDLGVIPVARSYLARSENEGLLPAGGGSDSVKARLAQYK